MYLVQAPNSDTLLQINNDPPKIKDFEPVRLLGKGGKYNCLLILGQLAVHFSACRTCNLCYECLWTDGQNGSGSNLVVEVVGQ
jgi:hypothetical protein